MNVVQNIITVAQFCQGLTENRTRVNKTYQRNDNVWSSTAQSFLIETLVKGFPIPKLFTHLKTNPKTKVSIEEIVDGQQRAQAILGFFNNELRLSMKCSLPALQGKKYEELGEEEQTAFLEYKMPIDQLLEASDAAIREVFLRINSHTASLNAEETRHATYQGDFKWFMLKCSEKYADTLRGMGVLSDKQLIRMQDLKLLTDYFLSLEKGLITTKAKELNAFYEANDEDFDREDEFDHALAIPLDAILGWPEILDTSLMKPHVFLSFLQAVHHAQLAVPAFSTHRDGGVGLRATEEAQARLSSMAADLDDPDQIPKKDVERLAFVQSCSARTNVGEQRIARFTALFDAVAAQD